MLLDRPFLSKSNKKFCIYFSDKFKRKYQSETTSVGSIDNESVAPSFDDGTNDFRSNFLDDSKSLRSKPNKFRNRFLNILRFGSVLDNAAESFFKSEIRRRLFVTAVLLVVSRIGYFIPLPGFDRRLIPEDYLSFVSGSVGTHLTCKLFTFILSAKQNCNSLLIKVC